MTWPSSDMQSARHKVKCANVARALLLPRHAPALVHLSRWHPSDPSSAGSWTFFLNRVLSDLHKVGWIFQGSTGTPLSKAPLLLAMLTACQYQATLMGFSLFLILPFWDLSHQGFLCTDGMKWGDNNPTQPSWHLSVHFFLYIIVMVPMKSIQCFISWMLDPGSLPVPQTMAGPTNISTGLCKVQWFLPSICFLFSLVLLKAHSSSVLSLAVTIMHKCATTE